MIAPNFYVVSKPWGEEYILYQNNLLAVWLLKLNSGQKTSFHCHPKKKTGFILLSGEVEIKIGFYEKKILNGLSKLMIRPGLFHETKTISKKDSFIIEIEVPNKKNDIVRFKDKYGRQNKDIEGESHFSALPQDTFTLFEKKNKFKKKYQNLNFEIKRFKRLNRSSFKNKNDIHAVLEGGLGKNKNSFVLCPGDIVRSDTIYRLTESFQPAKDILILTITK